jgi:hypothetical protein
MLNYACNHQLVRVNGRSLNEALNTNQLKPNVDKISNNSWVSLCPTCHAEFLEVHTKDASVFAQTPFLCIDNVMRTADDLNKKMQPYDYKSDLNFCGFKFSKSALINAIAIAQKQYDKTSEIEQLGVEMIKKPLEFNYLSFSEKVCEWGGGQRVWANLSKAKENTPETLNNTLKTWLHTARETNDYERAISLGTSIKGLGVSFASKHLRMVVPNKYAVLDEVLSIGLGFALNPKGYQFFMHSLHEFSQANQLDLNIATVESGIFLLVRQQVRAH